MDYDELNEHLRKKAEAKMNKKQSWFSKHSGKILLFFSAFMLFAGVIRPFLNSKTTPTSPPAAQTVVAQSAKTTPELPKNFDWKFYLKTYPDLTQHGIQTKEAAEKHWLEHGHAEGRKFSP